MKNRFEKTLLVACFASAALLTSCTDKKAEELNMVKKELILFEASWKTTQKEMMTTSTDLKDNLKEFDLAQLELNQLVESGGQKTSPEVQQQLLAVNATLDTLRIHMDSLNAYQKTWNAKSKSLNELIGLLNTQAIEPADARGRIADLQVFQSNAEPKLKALELKLKSFQGKHTELQQSINHLKKK